MPKIHHRAAAVEQKLNHSLLTTLVPTHPVDLKYSIRCKQSKISIFAKDYQNACCEHTQVLDLAGPPGLLPQQSFQLTTQQFHGILSDSTNPAPATINPTSITNLGNLDTSRRSPAGLSFSHQLSASMSPQLAGRRVSARMLNSSWHAGGNALQALDPIRVEGRVMPGGSPLLAVREYLHSAEITQTQDGGVMTRAAQEGQASRTNSSPPSTGTTPARVVEIPRRFSMGRARKMTNDNIVG